MKSGPENPVLFWLHSCPKANIGDRDQGKGECKPDIPPAVAGQARYVVSNFTQNRMGPLSIA